MGLINQQCSIALVVLYQPKNFSLINLRFNLNKKKNVRANVRCIVGFYTLVVLVLDKRSDVYSPNPYKEALAQYWNVYGMILLILYKKYVRTQI